MSRKLSHTQKLVGIAILAAASLIISSFSFPIIPAVPFLKMDFGDIPILLSMLAYGPLPGVLTAFLRSLMHYLLTGGEGGLPIGDFAAFIASVSLTLPIYYSLRRFGFTLSGRAVGVLSGSLSLTASLSLLNYFVLLPLYQMVMNFQVGSVQAYLVGAVVPFNIIKAIIVSMVFYLVYRLMRPWMEKNFLSSRLS